MSVSACLWRLRIVVTGCNGSRISLHAWIDGCLCYLLTTPHLDHRIGWKLVIVVISLILLLRVWTWNTWQFCLYQRCCNRSCWRVFFINLGRKCITSEERFVLELSTSRAMLATARPSCSFLFLSSHNKGVSLMPVKGSYFQSFYVFFLYNTQKKNNLFLCHSFVSLLIWFLC